MKLKTKKIIAREFLTLTTVTLIGLICFLTTFPYNSFRHNQIESIKKETAQKATLIDELLKLYKNKMQNQKWYFQRLNDEFDLGEHNTIEKWWTHSLQIAKKDSISILWKGAWSKDKSIITFFNKLGFNSGNSLQHFIIINTLNNSDIENKIKSENLQKEIVEMELKQKTIANSILKYEEQKEFGLKVLVVVFIILFGLRYLFYAIKWSFQILKEKSE